MISTNKLRSTFKGMRAVALVATALACVAGGWAAETAKASNEAQSPAAGSYQIRNKKFGELLRPKDANHANGTRIVLYPAQPWKCMTWKLLPASDGRFQLQNHFTSKTFAADTKSGERQPRVTQIPLARAEKERPSWQFTRLPDGSYKIVDSQSGKALTATKEAGERSPQVVIAPWQDGDSQKWQLERIDPKQLTM